MYIYMVASHHPSIKSVDKTYVKSPRNAMGFQQSVYVHDKIDSNPSFNESSLQVNENKGHQRDNLFTNAVKPIMIKLSF